VANQSIHNINSIFISYTHPQFDRYCIKYTMKLSLAALLLPSSVMGFTTAPKSSTPTSALQAELNGWVPNSSEFAFGLPGALDPVGDFDPLNLAEDASLSDMKRFREAETAHGRVAMLAVIGFLVTEAPFEFHPLFETSTRDIGPAIRHLDEVRAIAPGFFDILLLVIGGIELNRAVVGWADPGETDGDFLKPDYFPGDVGFDPLGLKPDNWEEFKEMSTKELQHGRLAMLAVSGIVAQELVNGKEIFVNLGVAPDDFDPSSLPVQF